MADENNKTSKELLKSQKAARAYEREAASLKKLADLEEQIEKADGGEKVLLQSRLELQEAINNSDLKRIKIATDSIVKLEAVTSAQEKLNETLKGATALGKSFGDSIFGLDSKLLNAVKSAGGATKAIDAFKDGIAEASKQSTLFEVTLDSVFTGVNDLVKGTVAAVSALDGAGASFVQNTGASRDFATAAFETRDSLGLMGISGTEAVETMGSLYAGFSEFTELSEDSQQSFIGLAAQINKLGGNAEGMSQVFTKVAGMSITQTTESMRLLHGAADALGIPFSQVSNDLIGMGDLFGKMGAAGMEVFLGLQAAAKATGMSVQSLYNIVGQYDTFENATQAAGRLNMVLGGNLIDTYSLLNATEEERIELLQEAMEQSSITFDDMDRWQRMEVASALNISLEEASQLFGTTRGEVEKTAAELMHAGMTQEELEQRTRDASTALDKFKVLMGNLAIAVGPIVEGINKMIDGFLELTEGWGATGAAFAVVGAGIVAALVKAGLAGLFFGAKMRMAAAVAGESGVVMAGGINSVGKAATANALGILALGAAFALIGVGVGAAAYGFSFLVEQFKEMSAGEILATSFAFVALAGAIGLLSVSIGVLGALGPVAFVGLGILAAAGLVLADITSRIITSIDGLNETKISSFATVLSSLAELASMSLTGTGIPAFIREIGQALDELPENTEKAVVFKATADSLSNLMQIASSVEAEQLGRIEMIIGAVSNAEGNEATGDLARAINSLVRGQANNEGRTVVIELDGQKLSRWIDRNDARRVRAIAT